MKGREGQGMKVERGLPGGVRRGERRKGRNSRKERREKREGERTGDGYFRTNLDLTW